MSHAGAAVDVVDAFPELGNDVFLLVAAELSLRDVSIALRVCKAWHVVLDGTDRLWSSLCEHMWASKAYVPASLRAMAAGGLAMAAAERDERRELLDAKIRHLKDLMRTLELQDGLVEKGEIADAILSARHNATEKGTFTHKLLHRPSLLVRHDSGESMPKAALRLSLVDTNRTFITEDELVDLTWSVRIRSDGPLRDAMCFDPWWSGHGNGEVRFRREGHLGISSARIQFSWPPNPDPEADGAPMDPFAAMGMPLTEAMVGWETEMEGRLVRILFNGQHGPQELVCRHPTTWGWVLYSQGTCWTSWAMPKCEAGQCSDPLLREDALKYLPCELQRDF